MKNRLFLLLLLVAGVSPLVVAEEIFVSRDQRKTDISIVQDNLNAKGDASLVVECHLQSLTSQEIATPQGNFTKLYVKGWQYTYNVGAPQLPMLSRLIELPLGKTLTVKLLSSTVTEEEAKVYNIRYPLYPTQPSWRKDQKDCPFAYSREAYQLSFGKDGIVEIEELGMLRSARLALLHFKPVQYSPLDSKIRIHNDIRAEIGVSEADMTATLAMKNVYATPYLDWTENFVLIPGSVRFVTSDRAAKKYLIIADPMFENNAKLKQFVAWKESLGLTVQLVFTNKIAGGATTTAIRAYIKEQYEKPADGVPPTFLLFVGDHEQIPGNEKTAPSRGTHFSDLDYCTITAGDYLPDILCGRFSASSSDELEPQLDKTMSYGKKEFSDASFLKRYALVAGWDGNWAVKRGYPQIRYATTQYFREPAYVAVVDYSAPDQNVFLTTGSSQNEANIVALVSKGVCLFNYTAHGDETSFADPTFSMSDIDSLNNAGQYPLVVGNCCLTGSFQVRTCFGEKWLRVANKGAIGYIGGSNYTYWDEDLWFGDGYFAISGSTDAGNPPEKSEVTMPGFYQAGFDRLHNGCNAGVMWAGNLAVTQSPNSTLKEYYWQVYHLFGDPSLEPLWANPDQTPPPVYPSKEFSKKLSTPLPIPDNDAQGVQDVLTVTESLATINLDVYLDITHTYIGDISVILTNKTTGKSFTVREKVGGGNDNIKGWQGKNKMFNGIDPKGEWVLVIKDTASGDTGTLNEWKVKIWYSEK
jgi:subtilisin-like proprotein convertase family protein